MCRREFEAVVRRDIRRAERAGADASLCAAARQVLSECDRMYRHKVSGINRLDPGTRRERRARLMSQYINRVDAIGALVRAYAVALRDEATRSNEAQDPEAANCNGWFQVGRSAHAQRQAHDGAQAARPSLARLGC